MANKILVVDDNPENAQTLVWAMEALGHDAHMAVDGVSALDAIESYTANIVLCDLNMPDINGYDVCRLMRQYPQLKHTTFIAQTGWHSELHKQAAHIHGFHHYLTKPIDFKELQEILDAPEAGI